ncbi:MAG: hypothetical protein H7X83_02930, partial [Verrucomicrobia bacterium]|nr:hypothetical protein [Deltaproteobacteria bacterium]
MAKDPQSEKNPLESIYAASYMNETFAQALQNLNSLPDIETVKKKYMPGKPFKKAGVI